MLVGERYASSDDASQQLQNTLVVLDDELCHLNRIEGWNYHILRVVQDGKHRRWAKQLRTDNIQHMDLALQQFQLGYVNYNKTSYYLKRKPLRKWKQGFYHEYLSLVENQLPADPELQMKHPWAKKIMNMPTVAKLMISQSMVDLYDNRYPSFRRAWVMVSMMDYDSVAWHRHWAFVRRSTRQGRRNIPVYSLHYKGKLVGNIVEGTVTLKHEFRYLTEPFVEAMIHAS